VNIGITGASGLIGRHIVDIALRRGHEIIAFSRSLQRTIPGCTLRLFAPPEPPDISGCDALIHLAGESVLGLWTPAKKRRITGSRIEGTRAVAEAIAQAATPPEVLVSGSAIGFYPDSGDTELTETSPGGNGFLAETTRAWEAEATAVQRSRVVLLRTGIALARRGGALGVMAPLFRWGLGGRLGPGTQWMSWIHVEDLARLFLFAAENLAVRGPVNGTAPWPERNAAFTRALARQLRRPAFFHAPAWAIRLAGEFSHELLDSKRVLPAAATEHGFRFEFPELPGALANLL
jgi:uncharacterized protein (TIGR01777 family)